MKALWALACAGTSLRALVSAVESTEPFMIAFNAIAALGWLIATVSALRARADWL